MNDYWFDVLGFSVLRAPKAVANLASRRISEKTGMRVIATHERDYVSGRLLAENVGNYRGRMAREEIAPASRSPSRKLQDQLGERASHRKTGAGCAGSAF